MPAKQYPAKILLFGEYTVLTGSRALAMPVHRWSGRWEDGGKVDERLFELSRFVKASELGSRFDAKQFNKDVSSGMYFQSTIPQGYGLGSSAALTAALYDKYIEKDPDAPVSKLKEDLALVEGVYHGQSSGMDPLVAYLDAPVLHERGDYFSIDVRPHADSPIVFLLNSGIGRFTGPLVSLFKSRLEDPTFVKGVVEPMIGYVDHAIDYYLSGSWDLFYDNLALISQIEFERFKEMLPEPIEAVWSRVKEHPSLVMKLCGAGGGGYFMGFAKPGTDVEKELGAVVEILDL